MKILLVSWSILPRPGGSSIIVENLAKNFGSEELVVFGGRGLFDSDVPRASQSPRFVAYFTEFHLFGRGHRYFNWLRKWRFRPLVAEITALIRREKIDYVIGVYPDDFFCYAACLAAKATKVPFSAYFHNTYVENVAIKDPRAPAIQSEIFQRSEHIFVMSKGMQRFYEAKYQLNKFVSLVHTYNDVPDELTPETLPGVHKKQYKLVAIGNFNESNLEATIRFAEAVRDHPKFQFSIYTHVPNLLLRQRGLDTSRIEHKGFIHPEAIHGALQDYDICVLTHGFTGGYGPIEYQTIFPTRTIPLLLSGKPVFVHSPANSFLNEFIQENQCADLVDQPDATAILAGLERIISDEAYQKRLVDAARQSARQFYGPEVVKNLQAILRGETVKV